VDDPQRWRIEVFRERLRQSLAARFVVRYHVAVMLAACIMGGWLADLALLHAGWRDMRWRYPLAIGAAYLAFLGAVRAWLWYSGIGEMIARRKADELLAEQHPAPLQASEWRWGNLDDAAVWWLMPNDGCLYVIVAYVAFFALGGYVLASAPSFAADVVLEALLAAGLIRGVRRIESSGWMTGVWKATRGSLAFTLVVSLLFGAWAHAFAPGASTAMQALIEARHPVYH
jgi:hypothetical protein